MFKKILMPTDGSDFALEAAEYCGDVAKRYNAEITILYVAEIPPMLGGPMREENEHTGIRQDLSMHARDAVKRTREVIEKSYNLFSEEVVFGSAVPSIIGYAQDGNFDLIVIGSRGSGTDAIEQILIGSVAEGILHGAPCPVLMIRPKQVRIV